jgi:hypothetical protein
MRVYKFLSAKWALRDITEHRIKLSEFKDMNDPFELSGSRWSDPQVDRPSGKCLCGTGIDAA